VNPRSILRRLRSLTLPGAAVLLVAVGFLRWADPEAVVAAARWVPSIIYLAGVLLAWRFNRTGLVFSTVTLGVVDAILRRVAGGETETPVGAAVLLATAFLLPWNLAGFSLMGQRGTWVRRGTLGLSLIAAQALLVGLVVWVSPLGSVAVLRHRFGFIPLAQGTRLGDLPLLAFALGFLFFVILALFGRRTSDHGFLWALAAGFMAILEGGGTAPASVYFGAGGLVLAVSVIEASFRLAYQDELTALPSRRAFNEALLKLGGEYAVAMVDIDHFKRFNDRFGHDVGDHVLRMVATKLERVGGGGQPYRYGGEEFAVVFAGLTDKQAMPHLEALREEIQETTFTLRGAGRPKERPEKPRAKGRRRQVKVTVSIGVSSPARGRTTPDRVVKAADKALYRAKEDGRNRVKRFSYFW
jgi:diguanylate cyclase (GGDEF)-like protein